MDPVAGMGVGVDEVIDFPVICLLTTTGVSERVLGRYSRGELHRQLLLYESERHREHVDHEEYVRGAAQRQAYQLWVASRLHRPTLCYMSVLPD